MSHYSQLSSACLQPEQRSNQQKTPVWVWRTFKGPFTPESLKKGPIQGSVWSETTSFHRTKVCLFGLDRGGPGRIKLKSPLAFFDISGGCTNLWCYICNMGAFDHHFLWIWFPTPDCTFWSNAFFLSELGVTKSICSSSPSSSFCDSDKSCPPLPVRILSCWVTVMWLSEKLGAER